MEDPPVHGHLVTNLLLGVQALTKPLLGQHLGVLLATPGAEPADLAEALLLGRLGLDLLALAVYPAVFVGPALVPVLALVSVAQGVAPTPPAVGLAVAGANVEEGLLLGEDVHVRAGPELVLLAPLRGLPHQPDGAVDALEIRGQRHLERLGSEMV